MNSMQESETQSTSDSPRPEAGAHPQLVLPRNPVWHLYEPRGAPVALVFDSPHSSDVFPEDFGHAVCEYDLREAEDCFIGELYRGAQDVGGVLLEAGFSRTYIDPNRSVTSRSNESEPMLQCNTGRPDSGSDSSIV